MDQHELLLNAAQAAQSAAVDSRELLSELLETIERREQAPSYKHYRLNLNTDPIEDVVDVDRAGGVVKSTAVVNWDAAVAIWVGWAGRQPRAASNAIRVQPRQLIVLPFVIDRVEISVDPGPAPAEVNSIQVGVIRFRSVQPFFSANV